MSRIPDELRRIIAENIHAERLKKFPGRGGCQKCAHALGVSPQQWSPWETGTRTPDEFHLQRIAEFFGVTVEHMRCAHASRCTTTGAFAPNAHKPGSPEASLHIGSCTENEIILQFHKIYSGMAENGQRVHVSVDLVLAKEE